MNLAIADAFNLGWKQRTSPPVWWDRSPGWAPPCRDLPVVLPHLDHPPTQPAVAGARRQPKAASDQVEDAIRRETVTASATAVLKSTVDEITTAGRSSWALKPSVTDSHVEAEVIPCVGGMRSRRLRPRAGSSGIGRARLCDLTSRRASRRCVQRTGNATAPSPDSCWNPRLLSWRPHRWSSTSRDD